MSNKIHKCEAMGCNNLTDTVLCDECLDKLGNLIDEYPLGCVPTRTKK